jgi:hypothetical protein
MITKLLLAYPLTLFTAYLYVSTYTAIVNNAPQKATQLSAVRILSTGLLLFFALNLPLKHSILMGILFGMTIYYGIKITKG